MFSLTIVFGPASTNWRLLFKTEEAANLAFGILERRTGEDTRLEDDYGQKLSLKGQLHGLMMEDMEKSKVGAIEYSLHGARTQANFNQRVQADPAMRAANMGSGMPMIGQVPGNGRFSG